MSITLDGTNGISTSDMSITKTAKGAVTIDNDLSFDLSVSNNFKCTPSSSGTLTFTNIAGSVQQSGYILLINSGGYSISKNTAVKSSTYFLTNISLAGTYLISYYSDGTNIYCTASGGLA